jgi:hypothetical protein
MVLKLPLGGWHAAGANEAKPELLALLWDVLLDEADPSGQRLLELGYSGELGQLLPEWDRLQSPINTQHSTHDFTLDVHTAYVLGKTRQSHYYQALTYREKQAVTAAALLHDIAKDCGHCYEREELSPDFYHPIKSVVVARRVLPQWGFNRQEVELICRIVYHHQLFGRLIIRFSKGEEATLEGYLQRCALLLQTETTLDWLLPLTEGDIRSVKANDALFSPRVEEKLAVYSQEVRRLLQALNRWQQNLVSANWHFQPWEEAVKALDISLSQKAQWPIYRLNAKQDLNYLSAPLSLLKETPHCFCQFQQQETEALTWLEINNTDQSLNREEAPTLWVDVATHGIVAHQPHKETPESFGQLCLPPLRFFSWQADVMGWQAYQRLRQEKPAYSLPPLPSESDKPEGQLLCANGLASSVLLSSKASQKQLGQALLQAQQYQLPLTLL